MGFPYLQPIKQWIAEEFEQREQIPEMESLKTPFAVLTSAAVVSKTNTYESAVKFETPNGVTTYHGCIIHSNINPDTIYSLNSTNTNTINTNIGFDFDGKQIVVDGETGAKRPTPIITSISIDTDGDNNALKTAQINLTIFTLKQLEMFELFFCRPGFNILLEFGNNFSLKENLLNKYKDFRGLNNKQTIFGSIQGQRNPVKVADIIIAKNDYGNFVKKEYITYSALNLDEQAIYHNKIIDTRGNYDVFAGKVTNFTMEIGDSGTYNVMLELSAGNTVSMSIPSTIISDTSKITALDEKGKPLQKEEIIKRQLRIDLNIPNLDVSYDYLKKHTFNFLKPNDLAKDSNVSELKYLTLAFIIKYLANYSSKHTGASNKISSVNPQKIKIAGVEEEAIPCKYNPKIISSSEDIIFPGMLPTFKIGNIKTNELVIDIKSPRNCKINGLDFKITGNIEIPVIEYNPNTKKVELNYQTYTTEKEIGNALNIFVNYNEVVECWKKSQTKADFINAILTLINNNSYNIFNLVIAPMHGDSGGGSMTIIDRNFSHLTDKDRSDIISPNKIYRFKTNGINSIVRQCTIQMDLGNLVAGQTVFQTSTAIENILKDLKDEKGKLIKPEYSIPLTSEKDAQANTYKNADGYYSVDGVEVQLVKKYVDEELQQLKAGNKNNVVKEKEVKAGKDKDKKVTEKPQTAESIIDSKVIKFKIPKETGGSGKIESLILNDKDYIFKEISSTAPKPGNKSLTNTNMTLTINGISGLSSGEYFKANGVPEIYNQNGVFQITNIKHQIDQQGWTTEIEAMWLIIS